MEQSEARAHQSWQTHSDHPFYKMCVWVDGQTYEQTIFNFFKKNLLDNP